MVKITKKGMMEAIPGSAGILANIARKIGCDRSAVHAYVKKNPEFKELIRQEDEQVNDLAEAKLITKLNEGDMNAIKFRLMTKAKDRGYVERREVVNEGRGDSQVVFNTLVAFFRDKGLPLEEFEERLLKEESEEGKK